VLSDKSKRAQYDQFGQTFEQGSRGGYGGQQGGFGGFDFSGFDFSDFSAKGGSAYGGEFDFGGGGFEDIFSDIFGGGGRGGRSRKGRDIQVDVEISFEEMVRGAQRSVRLRKTIQCDVCHGTGGEPGAKEETCPTCHGQGQVQQRVQSFFGTIAQTVTCPNCQGKGKIYSKKCHKCGGDGKVKGEVEIPIDIPAGIQDGQSLSLQGQGEAGSQGGRSGDLIVAIHVLPHPKFKRKGDDILSDEKITFAQAVLGGKISVETIDGPVVMKVPEGTQSGEVFRIKDKGVPFLQRRGRGSHLVKIVVNIPKKLSREQKRVIEELGKLD
jgi:molecular chaperone DnaJ